MARPSYPALRWLAIDAARADGRPAPSGEREPRDQRGQVTQVSVTPSARLAYIEKIEVTALHAARAAAGASR